MEKTLNRVVRKLARDRKLKKFKIRIYKNTVGLKTKGEAEAAGSDYSYPPEATAGHGSYYAYVGYVSRPEDPDPPRTPPKPENLFSEETAHGSHHNYSYDYSRRGAVIRLFRNFLPVSLFLSGSGHIIRMKKGKCVYGFSQRAPHVNCLDSMESPLTHRPLVSTKEDTESPVYDGTEKINSGRLHIVSRDATRCEYQTWLVDMVTHLVLRLAEEGWKLPKSCQLTNPLRALHDFNVNLTPRHKVRTRRGQINVVDYNRIFWKAARGLKNLSAKEKIGLREWRRVLDAFESEKFRLLIGKLDWATKLVLVARARKKGFGLNSAYAWKLLMDYHDISSCPKQSSFAQLDRAGLIRHLISEKNARRLMSRPPKTRARARGLFVKLGKDFFGPMKNDEFCIGWEGARFLDEDIVFGDPDNPLRANISAVKNLFRTLSK